MQKCMTNLDLYNELPYQSFPIEWTAPERLTLASLLHGGPWPPLDSYRVLELGCGNGANLLPMAYYRRHATFVGVDGASDPINVANSRRLALELSNVEFLHADLLTADQQLSGDFDYIIAHGIFSWIPIKVRDALLQLCAKRLRRGGLFYLNYNANPGWKVRGMVRDFLLAQTRGTTSLRLRAQLAQDVAAKVVSSLTIGEHAYSQLIANEFQFVCENDISYIAHEYLAPDNHSYWRSEFMTLVRAYGFEYVADADFNYSSGRIPEDLAPRLVSEQITGHSLDDTVDFLCYRQLHSPILTQGPLAHRLPSLEEFANLLVASCLAPCAPSSTGNPMFQHPSGYEVEAKVEIIRIAFEKLHLLWPRGLRIGAVFPDVSQVMDDLKLLQRNGLIELRCIEPDEFGVCREPLNRLEDRWGEYVTTAYHTREIVATEFETDQKHTNAHSRGERGLDGSGYRKDLLSPHEISMGAA